MEDLTSSLSFILPHFDITYTPSNWSVLGVGNIHHTFLISSSTNQKLVFQKINTNIFNNPDILINNYHNIYKHLKSIKHFPLRLPAPVGTKDERRIVQDETGGYWRAFEFVENTFAMDRSESAALTQKAAEAVGIFLRHLDGLPPSMIVPAIPGFHDSVQRLQFFEDAVRLDRVNRKKEVLAEIEFIRQEASVFHLVNDLQLPERIVHADPKIGNLLFDQDTYEVIAVLDWDTIMPGTLISDFGDMVRTMAATCPEDEVDVHKVWLDITLFEALVNGFLKPLRGWITHLEINHLITGARWIILEQMMRFLTDYIDGDIYYKISYPYHNLIRARNQMKLYDTVKDKEEDLIAIIIKNA